MSTHLKHANPFRQKVRNLITGALLHSLFVAGALAEGVASVTLAFEQEGFDLDTGRVITALSPINAAGADIKIAYNALGTHRLHALVLGSSDHNGCDDARCGYEVWGRRYLAYTDHVCVSRQKPGAAVSARPGFFKKATGGKS